MTAGANWDQTDFIFTAFLLLAIWRLEKRDGFTALRFNALRFQSSYSRRFCFRCFSI
jgi:Gpi18-like mannosyltransferase